MQAYWFYGALRNKKVKLRPFITEILHVIINFNSSNIETKLMPTKNKTNIK